MNYIWQPVPNFSQGRKGNKIQGIVLHIGEADYRQIYSTFLNEEKSSHYCIKNDGIIVQFVKDEDTAWHAGIKVNPTARLILDNLEINPNLYLLGIEHSGYGINDITEAQYEATARLVNDLSLKYDIPLDRKHIIRHSEIRANKTCPGKLDVDRIVNMAIQIRNFQPVEKKTEEKVKILTALVKLYEQLISVLKNYGK